MGGDIVLEVAEFLGDVVPDEIGAGAEDLAELHEGRPEVAERRAQALPERRGLAALGGHEVEPAKHAGGQAVLKSRAPQEVGEAMPDHHLEHLGEAHGVDGVFSKLAIVHVVLFPLAPGRCLVTAYSFWECSSRGVFSRRNSSRASRPGGGWGAGEFDGRGPAAQGGGHAGFEIGQGFDVEGDGRGGWCRRR